MGEAVLSIIPMEVGAALVPGWIVVGLLLLRRHDGILASSAFVGGMTAVRILQGAAFGLFFAGMPASRREGEASIIVSTLLLVMGLMMWATAVRGLLKGGDDDAPPSKWLSRLDAVSWPIVFAVGMALVVTGAKQWVFMLATAGTIEAAGVNRLESILLYLIYIFIAEALLLLPIVAVATGKPGPAALVRRTGTWLEAHARQVVIVVSIVFGTWFLWKGISGLAG